MAVKKHGREKEPFAHFAIGDFIDKKEAGKWKRAGIVAGFNGKIVSIQKKGDHEVKTNFSDFIGKVKREEYRVREKE